VYLIASLLFACSTSPDLAEPPPSPPMATGEVCVDATPAGAVVTVAGQPLTARCTTVEQAYSAEAEVVVSAPGHTTHTATVGLTGGTETVAIELAPLP